MTCTTTLQYACPVTENVLNVTSAFDDQLHGYTHHHATVLNLWCIRQITKETP